MEVLEASESWAGTFAVSVGQQEYETSSNSGERGADLSWTELQSHITKGEDAGGGTRAISVVSLHSPIVSTQDMQLRTNE